MHMKIGLFVCHDATTMTEGVANGRNIVTEYFLKSLLSKKLQGFLDLYLGEKQKKSFEFGTRF